MAIPPRVEIRDAQVASAGAYPTWDAIAENLGDAVEKGRSMSHVRAIVRLWCAEARRRQLAPEQFLVVIKSQFTKIPVLRQHAGDEPAHTALLESIVSMCIEEYFERPELT